MRLAECVPALTPAAALALPWGYAMGLINTRRHEIERASAPADGSGGTMPLPPVEQVTSRSGFKHAPGYSQMLRMFSR